MGKSERKPKYRIEVAPFSKLRDKIEIPKFQRGLVWNNKKKTEFIKTLKSGLPIGVLLLYKRGEKYLVIDGLQRFSTMLDYEKDIFRYIDQSEISDVDLMSIIFSSEDAKRIFNDSTQPAKDAQFGEMRKIIVEEIKNGRGKNPNQISTSIAKSFSKKIAAFPEKDVIDIIGATYNVVEKISEDAKIDDVTIPLIIFEGQEDELANIFQKLNQEGVKLSKYDVFAATWIDHSVVVKNDPDFIEHIINKYDRAKQDSDLEIANYDPEAMKQNGELTVFEYAFALGKALMTKCKKLFPKQDDAKVDSIGFTILAELMGLSYQEMDRLADEITTYKNLDFKKLKDAIVEVAVLVEGALSPYLDSPTKTRGTKRTSLACHSELQLASYIIVIFKLKYDLSPEKGLIAKPHNKTINTIKSFLHKHYLFDILRGFWSGSGDSKLEIIIADPETCRYTKDVAPVEFETALSNWLDDANKKDGSKTISADTKLFLNYLLRQRVPSASKNTYDIEHCVPQDVLNKYYAKKGIKVPISSPCNLAYIPSSDNRSKGDLTYYQRQDNDPGTFQLDEQYLDLLVYPQRSELRFVESVSTLDEKNYRDFLKNRKDTLTRKFMDSFYK